MPHSALRIGLIGAGRIGQVHAANIAANPDTDLTIVCDHLIDSARSVAARYGGLATDQPQHAIDLSAVDAVLIASPTPTHIDLIAASVRAGLPVFCEKPIDLDLVRVDALRPVVTASGVPVAIGFNRRFDPAFREARDRVHRGEIGTLEQLAITSRDPSAPPSDYIAASGGIFRDMTIHDFDMARFFAPDIVEVHATGTNTFDVGARENNDFDTAVVVLRATSGAIITITNSRHSAIGYDQRLEAFGASGVIQVGNAHTSLVAVSTSGRTQARSPYQHFFLQRYADAYAAELHEFVALARGEDSAIPGFDDGRAALILADAAQRSARTHHPVAVDLDS